VTPSLTGRRRTARSGDNAPAVRGAEADDAPVAEARREDRRPARVPPPRVETDPRLGSTFRREAEGIAIEVTGVSKWYKDLVAVSDVTCRLGFGVTALLGPNGAGKSTLFRMLCGLTPPSKGTIEVLGGNPRNDIALTRSIGLVPQQEGVFEPLTAFEFVELAAVLHGAARPRASAADALTTVQLDPSDERPLTSYSKGMRQRVKVAQALVHDPKVLFLDEPLTGLDPRQRLHMVDVIQELGDQGKCVVVSSHVLEEVERFSARVLVIVKGRLAAQGDFRAIRALMDDRPHRISVRASDSRVLGTALLAHARCSGVEIVDAQSLVVETTDVEVFRHLIAAVARRYRIRLYDVTPLDDDLESVFRYLVGH
jgi:ABC-2 type transport system ATP-binding protein